MMMDLTGQRYGKLTVIREDERKGYTRRWLCRCDCGNEKVVAMHNLRTGHTTSCGCVQRERTSEANSSNLTGMAFGRLRVIGRADDSRRKTRKVYWLCECECGKRVRVPSHRLISGASKSCGCLRIEAGKSVQEYNESKLRIDGVMTHNLKRKVRVDSKSGVKGVRQRIKNGKTYYQAYIAVKGEKHFGAWTTSLTEAARERKLFEDKYHKPYIEALEERTHEGN